MPNFMRKAGKKYTAGGSLKPIPKGNKGLGKLSTAVRNKMGYMMYGGSKIKKYNIGGGFSSNTNWNQERKLGKSTIGIERGLITDKKGNRMGMAYGYAKKGGSMCRFGCMMGPNGVL